MNDLSFLFNEPITCDDGYNVSIQASEGHYCTPRKDNADYTAVELGFPSVAYDLLTPYAEDSSKPTDTVYGWVPVDVVAQLIVKHGGIVSGELPRSTALETALETAIDSTALPIFDALSSGTEIRSKLDPTIGGAPAEIRSKLD